MKIILLGHRDLASNLALSELVGGLPGHKLKICLSGHVASDDALSPALHELAAVDTGFCNAINKGRGVEGENKPPIMGFDELAEATGFSIDDLDRPNSPQGLQTLRQFEPDLIVSVRYRRILRQEVIDLPPLGVLNLHSGLLPGYKGVMATFWAMLNDEPEIGSTVHYIDDASIDTGAIISQQSKRWSREKSYLWNVLSLYPSGCQALLAAISSLAEGQALATRGKIDGGHYYSFPTDEDIGCFRNKGLELCNPNELKELSSLLSTSG